MNERIKELMDQARDKTPKGLSFDTGLSSYSKRFADLIVRECARLADNSPQFIDGREILEHFGVEE